MRKLEFFAALSLAAITVLGLAVAIVSSQDTALPDTVSGIILDANGEPTQAIVQVRGTPNQIETAGDGLFELSDIGGTQPVTITAWSEGHYIGWATLDPTAPDLVTDNIEINLVALPQTDNYEYDWFSAEGVDGSAACGLCHREYEEWRLDQHSQSAVNHRFLSVYTGTDINGEMGQPVQWGSNGYPQLPDPDLPYTGPGFVPDNPGGRAGNCTSCHVPMVSKLPNNQNCTWSGCHTNLTIERATDFLKFPGTPLSARGHALEGISCDFCHKVVDVVIDPETGRPPPDMPGILSMRLLRPVDEDHQVFFGNLIDAPTGDSYLPLLSESQFCAACHYGVFGGVMGVGTMTGGLPIYNSFGEWLDSPYSDPVTGQTCQDCHMPPSDQNWFVFAERGGLKRDHVTLHNHAMLGASSEELLQNTVTMENSVQRVGDELQLQVSLTNTEAGHHVPTDHPSRSLILVVEALNADGQPLDLVAGSVNPDFSGDYGGLPGKTFALILRDEWTGEVPTIAVWREMSLVEDTRLAALATDTTDYTFAVPADADVTINVTLLYRRAFYDLMQQKGWNDPDILMEHETIHVPAN
jgi:hypothetical protein